MKKVFMFLVACLMAFGVSLTAKASSRIDALNSDARATEDYDLIFLYPNKVTEYKNTVDFRMPYPDNTNDQEWGGFLDSGHGLGTVGVYVFRPNGFDGTGNWMTGTGDWWSGVGGNNWYGRSSAVGWLNVGQPENKLDLFWGDTVAENTTFGVQFNYGDNAPSPNNGLGGATPHNQTTTTDDPNGFNDFGSQVTNVTGTQDSRTLGVNLGLGMKDVGPFSQLNIHAGYDMGSIDVSGKTTPITGDNFIDTGIKDNGIYTIKLGGLAQHDLDENSNIRFFADGYLDSTKTTSHGTFDNNGDGAIHFADGDVSNFGTIDDSDTIVELGIACNHKVADGRGLVTAGLTADWESQDYKNGFTALAAGDVQQAIDSNTGPGSSDEEYKYDYLYINWNVGVEAKLADWFTLRAGINRPIFATESDTDINKYNYVNGVPQYTTTTKSTYDPFSGSDWDTFTLGAGINFGGNWTLDMFLDHETTQQWLAEFSPGNGIFYDGGNGTLSTSSMAFIEEMDLKYKF